MVKFKYTIAILLSAIFYNSVLYFDLSTRRNKITNNSAAGNLIILLISLLIF